MKEKIIEIMCSINDPISEKKLARRANISIRKLRKILNSDPNKFKLVRPIRVGSHKYDYSSQNNFSGKKIYRKQLRVWKCNRSFSNNFIQYVDYNFY